MKWQRGDKYYIHCGCWNIARADIRAQRIYTLWSNTTKEWIASRRAITDQEAKIAIDELKEVASGLE